jgi:hypothetical protein
MTSDAETRLRQLNRDWDRINHARQKEREAAEKALSPIGASPTEQSDRTREDPHA